VSSGDKNQSSLMSSGSQQNPIHSSLSNSLSSALSCDDKTEPKKPVSKYGRRFNQSSSGRQYQVYNLVVLSVMLMNDISFRYPLLCNPSTWFNALLIKGVWNRM